MADFSGCRFFFWQKAAAYCRRGAHRMLWDETVVAVRMEKESGAGRTAQDICIEGRESLYVSGVHEVVSFDERMVDIKTELGRLVVRGEGMKFSHLNPETKELQVTGYVCSCEYEDTAKKQGGLIRGMFR